jgi:hypothetical protein
LSFVVHKRDLDLIEAALLKSDPGVSKQAILDRIKRDLVNPGDPNANNPNNDKLMHKHDHDHAKEQLQIKIKSKEDGEHAHEHAHGPSHSAIGVTLVLGFVFMLFIDQIGGKMSHRHHGSTSK